MRIVVARYLSSVSGEGEYDEISRGAGTSE